MDGWYDRVKVYLRRKGLFSAIPNDLIPEG